MAGGVPFAEMGTPEGGEGGEFAEISIVTAVFAVWGWQGHCKAHRLFRILDSGKPMEHPSGDIRKAFTSKDPELWGSNEAK